MSLESNINMSFFNLMKYFIKEYALQPTNLSRALSGYGYPKEKSAWEYEYQHGQWEHLMYLSDLGHYSVISGYIQYFGMKGKILDVGCGEGMLYERLSEDSYSDYVGIDISEAAIETAIKKIRGNTIAQFMSCDAILYRPDKLFNIVVFNESLYLFEQPLKVMQQYRSFLKDDGVFIVSMFNAYSISSRNYYILNKIKRVNPPIDETRVMNKNGETWVCTVFGK